MKVLLHLSSHLTDRPCPVCGELMSYEPGDPRDADHDGVGVLGCECGHGEPAAIVRDYEASIGRSED